MGERKKTVIGPYTATITRMGPQRGVLIPSEFYGDIEPLLNVKKHKITITIEPVDPA